MLNGVEYKESLRKIKPKIIYQGENIECVVDHPMTAPHVNSAAQTYNFAFDPEYNDLIVTKSHLTGKNISRFTSIHQSTDD